MEGFVYLIGSPLFGWYKIGKSKTPEVRVSNLGILLPFKLQIIGIWKAKNHSLLETTLHEKYKANAINGDWFEFTAKEAYAVFNSLPVAVRIFPIDNVSHSLDRFSNVATDTKNRQKVIGVRVQKLRGTFTTDEREEIKITSIAHQNLRKALRNITGYSTRPNTFSIVCNNPYKDKKVKINTFTSLF